MYWQERYEEHDADCNQHVVCPLHPCHSPDPAHLCQVLQVGVGPQEQPDLSVEEDDAK